MEKRATAGGVISTLVLLVFLVIVISIIYNLMTESGSVVTGLGDEVPGAVPRSDALQQITMPDKDQTAQWESFIARLNSDAQGPCLLQYDGLDKLEGWSITFSQKDTGIWFVNLINPDKISTTLRADVNKELCVVGGEIYSSRIYVGQSENIVAATIDGKGVVTPTGHFEGLKTNFDYDKNNIKWAAKNFYTNWIEDLSGKEPLYQTIRSDGKRIVAPDYTNPKAITITGNSMSVSYGSESKEWGKEDGGLLYVPESGKVCVFGTIARNNGFGCDPGLGGLDNDCFDDSDEDLIFRMPQC